MKSLSLSQPHLIILVGIPGSGKSTFAEKFSATFHTPYINYDTILELADHNASIAGKFTIHMLETAFRTGQAIVFDGPSESKAQRQELKDIALDAGYTPLFVWVQTDSNTSRSRFLKAGKKAGRRVTPAMFEGLMKEFDSPQGNEPHVVISGKHTFATQVKAVLKHLVANRQLVKPLRPKQRPAVATPRRGTTAR